MGTAAVAPAIPSCGGYQPACSSTCHPVDAPTLDTTDAAMAEYRHGSGCCMKAHEVSRFGWSRDGNDALRKYFLSDYLDGVELSVLRGYSLERIDTGTSAFVHVESHISVWSEAVNIASEESPRENLRLLFHYCPRSVFMNVTKENRKDAELFVSLIDSGRRFGTGIYTSSLAPTSFRSRRNVLENMFTTELETCREDDFPAWLEKVAFCIPIIAPDRACYDVRDRPTPEMIWGKGHDIHGSILHPGRDLSVIRVKDEPRNAHNAAASYEEVLRRRLARHESDGDRDTAVQDFMSLGRHIRRRDRNQEALQFFEKGLNLSLAVYGNSHPSVATFYNEMAVVYHRNGQFEQALEYYELTLNIQIETLGKSHPHVASTYNNIAVVHGRQNNYEKALEYYSKAQDIKLETLGEGHPSVAATYHNMANIYRRQENYTTALVYYDKALEIRLASLGDTHPSVGDTHYNMGMIFRYLQRSRSSPTSGSDGKKDPYDGKALVAFRAAHKAYLETYGPDNRETCDAKNQMLVEESPPDLETSSPTSSGPAVAKKQPARQRGLSETSLKGRDRVDSGVQRRISGSSLKGRDRVDSGPQRRTSEAGLTSREGTVSCSTFKGRDTVRSFDARGSLVSLPQVVQARQRGPDRKSSRKRSSSLRAGRDAAKHAAAPPQPSQSLQPPNSPKTAQPSPELSMGTS